MNSKSFRLRPKEWLIFGAPGRVGRRSLRASRWADDREDMKSAPDDAFQSLAKTIFIEHPTIVHECRRSNGPHRLRGFWPPVSLPPYLFSLSLFH